MTLLSSYPSCPWQSRKFGSACALSSCRTSCSLPSNTARCRALTPFSSWHVSKRETFGTVSLAGPGAHTPSCFWHTKGFTVFKTLFSAAILLPNLIHLSKKNRNTWGKLRIYISTLLSPDHSHPPFSARVIVLTARFGLSPQPPGCPTAVLCLAVKLSLSSL